MDFSLKSKRTQLQNNKTNFAPTATMDMNRTIPKKRTTNFREDETKLLIQLWGCPQIQNKLYLTHRKAPVMRLIAANMQKHGFYRTPDEIKTRIRNLKCLYHRIKKSVLTGAGVGTVDPDWPHYKAMDEILSKRALKRQHENIYKEGLFSEIMPEITIKQEVLDEVDMNDDMDSYTTNSKSSDDEFEETASMPPLTPAPHVTDTRSEKEESPTNPIKIAPKPTQSLMNPTTNVSTSSIFPSIQFPLQNHPQGANSSAGGAVRGSAPSLPFPLLILNGVSGVNQGVQQGLPGLVQTKSNALAANIGNNTEVCKLLKELLDVQRDHLEIEKERIELEKRKLDFERLVGSQLLTLIPMLGGIFQSLKYEKEEEDDENENDECNNKNKEKTNKRKRKTSDTVELFKESKILRDVLESGIKKYMNEDNEHSDTSGISNDSSIGSAK